MRDLINKLFLFIICSYILRYTGLDADYIINLLAALALSSLCTYYEHTKQTGILLGLYCLLCLLGAASGIYLPLMLYDGLFFHHPLSLAAICAAGFFTLWKLPHSLIFPYIIIFAGSAFLCLYSRQIKELLHRLHLERDESRENAILMRERNQALREKQDYEIHVATLSERNRIAREIHDNVGHMLTRSILQTGALRVINKDPALKSALTELGDTLNTAMDSIRTSVHDLHDEAIDLHDVLEDLISRVQSPTIRLEYDINNPLPQDVKYAFISIVKEAITNMQKHSDANTAQITVREHPGFYHLQIRDNGSAKSSPESGSGIGLTNMKERVLALGGTIRFSTDNGFGINISIMR
ncbi:MAG: sensor histidine kinase [Roseburia sp.]|nr:sensor histidine kinase [Roseburia sp.]